MTCSKLKSFGVNLGDKVLPIIRSFFSDALLSIVPHYNRYEKKHLFRKDLMKVRIQLVIDKPVIHFAYLWEIANWSLVFLINFVVLFKDRS